jgi:hypothetical protein
MLLANRIAFGVAAGALFWGCRPRVDETPSFCTGAPTSAPAVDPESEAYRSALLRKHAFAVSCAASGEAASDPTVDPPGLAGIATDCAAIAADCSAWLACSSGGHCPDFCPMGFGWVCDGDTLVVCSYTTPNGTYGTVWDDCAAKGMHCDAGSASCTTGASCSAPADYHCEGNVITACNGGLAYAETCSAGFTCQDVSFDGAPSAACVEADAPTCSSPAPHCNGDVLELCLFGQFPDSIDCTSPAIEATCLEAFGNATCVPLAPDCTDGAPDRCHGDALSTCLNGHFRDVDCTSIGFRTCRDGGPGPAVCVP